MKYWHTGINACSLQPNRYVTCLHDEWYIEIILRHHEYNIMSYKFHIKAKFVRSDVTFVLVCAWQSMLVSISTCIINAPQLQARHGIEGEKNIVVTFH